VTDGLGRQRLGLVAVGVAVLAVVAVLGGQLEEAWHPTGPVINEIASSSASTIADEDGDFPDWIELHNPTDEPAPLAGYHLSDDPDDPARWAFPDLTLEADGYLVVFASGKDRRDVGGELHTELPAVAGRRPRAADRPRGGSGRPVRSGRDPPRRLVRPRPAAPDADLLLRVPHPGRAQRRRLLRRRRPRRADVLDRQRVLRRTRRGHDRGGG
jgi:hypothetical protein